MDFTGTWYIFEMEVWNKDYFNMEVQAYIQINSSMLGNFQFGLVTADIDGMLVNYADGERFEFTGEGNDENDPISGSGWLKIIDDDLLEGEFRIYRGDSSRFRARKTI